MDHCLEDVSSVLKYIRNDELSEEHRIDKYKIVLVGHSMGGFMALRTIVDDPVLLGAVWIAGGNISEFGRWAGENTKNRISYERYVQDSSAPLEGIDVEELINEVINNPEKWDLRIHAEILAKRKIFLIGASKDEEVPLETHYLPLVNALNKHNPEHLTHFALETDHSFSDKRIELARIIISWLKKFQ